MRFGRFMTLVTALLPVLLTSGCGTLTELSGPAISTEERNFSGALQTELSGPAIRTEERNFAGALQYLQSGNETAARDLFERTVDAPPLKGVTDEALFRLAVLNLRDEGGKGEPRARALLGRLIREFPASIWARQASPLAAHLQEVLALRGVQRELKSLRNQNLSLSHDNKELRQSIERLKQLDMELEQKIRR